MKKRAQEEIIGFVLVVVIVAIIFLVFLGISLRQEAPVTQRESGDVSQFLESTMEYTSECSPGQNYPYLDLGELIRYCYLYKSDCFSGEDSCLLLNRTLQEIIEKNWQVGADRPVKGYLFNSTYVSSSKTETEEVLFISKGNCTIERIGAEHLFPVQAGMGNIRSSLEICY